MTEAMPFLQKTILLSYDPRPFRSGGFFHAVYDRMIRNQAKVTAMEVTPMSGMVKVTLLTVVSIAAL